LEDLSERERQLRRQRARVVSCVQRCAVRFAVARARHGVGAGSSRRHVCGHRRGDRARRRCRRTAVRVHSFEFGDVCPTVLLKDVCDPLPEFYEDSEDSEREGIEGDRVEANHDNVAVAVGGAQPKDSFLERREHEQATTSGYEGTISRPTIDTRLPLLRSSASLADHLASPLLSRSATPGIPGGTSSLTYFHLPLGAGLSGTQTPLAAIGGNGMSHGLFSDNPAYSWEYSRPRTSAHQTDYDSTYTDPSTRPSTAHSYMQSSPQKSSRSRAYSDARSTDVPPSPDGHHQYEPSPTDLQIVLHITYSGNVRLSLTAEILLDYPMPSFVGIPLQLKITGLTFDGVAILAYLRKKAHFCFLGQEDAEALIGAESLIDLHDENEESRDEPGVSAAERKSKAAGTGRGKLGGLLQEIRVESEIGQREGGRQSLKNVGKVESFVLAQVRRIFEEEFVYPSFWTFLV
jgi:mitochondrial distribution and morphology protein 12